MSGGGPRTSGRVLTAEGTQRLRLRTGLRQHSAVGVMTNRFASASRKALLRRRCGSCRALYVRRMILRVDLVLCPTLTGPLRVIEDVSSEMRALNLHRCLEGLLVKN